MLYKAEFNSPIGPLGLLADKEKILKLSFKGLKDINEEAKEEPFPVDEKEETFSTSDLKERLNKLSDEQQASAKKWIAQDLRGVTTADGKLLSEVSALQLAQLEEVYLKITQ